MKQGWEVKSLSDVCERVFAGGDVPQNNFSKTKTDKYSIPIYANGATEKGLYGYTDIVKVNEPSITVSARGTIGYSEIRNESFFPIVRLIVLTPNTEIISLSFLKYVISGMDFKNSGTSIPQLTVPMIKRYKSSIPPLPEQKLIVAKLDECFQAIDKARANVEKNLNNAKEQFQSQLNQIFSQKGEGWVEKKLGEVTEVIAGQSPKGKYYNDKGDGLPFYQGKKLFGEKHLDEPNIWTSVTTKESYAGDIVMSVRAPVGDVNFNYHKKICIGRGLAGIRAGETVNKDYLFYFLVHHKNEIVGNTGAVFNSINKTQISNIIIPMVDLAKQNEIVNQLDNVKSQTQTLESNYQQELDALDELKKSILQRAFSGEL